MSETLPLFTPPPAPEPPRPATQADVAAPAGWWDGPIASFDLETTSASPWEARIVTAAILVQAPDGTVTHRLELLADPDVEIPEEAAKVHGITTARARAYGRPAREAVATIAQALALCWRAPALPVVIFKAEYDWTVLTAECERHGIERPKLGPLVDPLVLDRYLDKFRKGKRTLGAMTAHYGVQLTAAHTADADALAAVEVARHLARQFPLVRRELPILHQAQARWFQEWREGINRYWAERGETKRVPPGWPLSARPA